MRLKLALSTAAARPEDEDLKVEQIPKIAAASAARPLPVIAPRRVRQNAYDHKDCCLMLDSVTR